MMYANHIRWMGRRDVPAVLLIEQACFGPHAWDEAELLGHLWPRNHVGKVVEVDGCILGYLIYQFHDRRYEIIGIAVDPEIRRQGVGAAMVNHLKAKCGQHSKRKRVRLHVREANLGAHLFFRSQGFQATSVVRDYFEDSEEDAYLMQFSAQGTAVRRHEATP